MRYKLHAIIVPALMALNLFPFSASFAASGINLQTSPLPIYLNVKPGDSATSDLKVRNDGSQTERLQVRLLKVTEDDNGNVHLTQTSSTDQFVSWVSFSRSQFDAPTNVWETVTMTVKVPKDAAFGYYFAVEFLRATDEQAQPGQEVAKGAIATFVLLNAEAAGAKRDAQLVSFTADHQSYEFLPATFTVKVRATGNVHVAPYGNIYITQNGKQVDVISINAAQGDVLPGSSRFFTALWSNGFPHYEPKLSGGQPVVDKNGKTKMALKWDLGQVTKLRFGHYTATLTMIYDNGTRDIPLTATLSFWVIPWRLFILGVAIPVVPAVGAYFLARWNFRRKLRKPRP